MDNDLRLWEAISVAIVFLLRGVKMWIKIGPVQHQRFWPVCQKVEVGAAGDHLVHMYYMVNTIGS